MSRNHNPLLLGVQLIADEACPMRGFETHRLAPWVDDRRMGAIDVSFRAGYSCHGCKKTWTHVERSAYLVPPQPTWPDPTWPKAVRMPV